MKYEIDIQYRPRNAARPEDEPLTFPITADDQGTTKIPSIGDHVVFLRGNEEQVAGVVENRLFSYLSPDLCWINIVVTDSDTNSGMLIKE